MTPKLCKDCGGRLDKVGLYNCNKKHPKPNLIQKIVRAIEDDLNDRRGIKLEHLDDDIAYEIKDRWEVLIAEVMKSHEKDASKGKAK